MDGPSIDMRDDDHSESDDDDYHDDGFEAAHAAYLARRIAEAAADSRGMSPFDESVIDREWEELVNSMKAIVPSQLTTHRTLISRRPVIACRAATSPCATGC